MDDIDRTLLETLRGNARVTYAELGRAVGMSAPAAHDRVGRLEASGVITGYHAAVEPMALGLGVSALVGVYLSDSHEQEEVADALHRLAEIEDCWSVAGDEAFVIKARVPDVDHLELFIGTLRRIPGIARTHTTVVLSTRWEGRIRSAHHGSVAEPAS